MFLNLLAGGTTLAAQVAAIFRKYGTDAHVYLPGIGVINGLTAGNYLDSAGTTAATVDNPVGLVVDSGGINAIQATTANKPILRRGAVNKLTYSNDFGNAAWTKTASTIPTANTLLASAGAGSHNVLQSISFGILGVNTVSIEFKAGTNTKASIGLWANETGWNVGGVDSFTRGCLVDLSAGTILGTDAGITSRITAMGDGWYRVSITNTTAFTSATGIQARYYVAPNTATLTSHTSFTAAGTESILIRYAQSEQGSTVSTYIPTTTAPASSSTGNYWWQFDSTDLLTATFPAGYESATIINTAETGQVTYTGQNIVGNYGIRGAEIGSELVTNGTFDTDTGWNKSAGVTITGGVAVFNAVTSGIGLSQAMIGGTSGKVYKVTVTISGFSSGSLATRMTSGSYITLGSANGTFSAYVVAGGNTLQLYSASVSSTFNVDNVTVRELTPKEYAHFIFRTGLTASELATMQAFANRLAGV